MRVNLLCIESSVVAVGFRKMISFIESIHKDVQGYYLISSDNANLSYLAKLFRTDNSKNEGTVQHRQIMVREVAETLAQGDIVGFSSYTQDAEITKQILREVKSINPKAFTIWGGIHPIIDPEDAILHADAICTGEGEFAIEEFLPLFKEGKDFYGTKNFWFNKNGAIIKNDFFPLANSEQMDSFPLPQYGENELVYKDGKGFVPLTEKDYLESVSLSFNTVWSIGCPYHCSYCGNTKFIENDKSYVKLRHPSVDYLIRQIKDVMHKHPHVSTIIFHDDSFMAIPRRTLKDFAEKWKREIKLPFCVTGVIPSFVQEDKMAILVDAGMNRLRMGVQSGSDRILEFYQRPNKPGLIIKAAMIISKFKDYLIPPSYDIILDNPIETKQDVKDTLILLYDMPRPFSLNIYSLRIIPNTVLHQQMKEEGIDLEGIAGESYLYHAPTFANAMIYLLAMWKPPQWLFAYLLKFARPYTEKQQHFSFLILFLRYLYLVVRVCRHLRLMDFSVRTTRFAGRVGWVLWKLGFLRVWKNRVLKSYTLNKA
jgi:anaerobic magnesium-protoporphyrin IX monomethyl ester cyclase